MAEPVKQSYRAELEGIRAPLGIILFLIRRDNLNIYDIPIARITKEYIEYLDLMEKLNIDLAGEFFIMAATLMRIKVQMLLKKEDDEEDPRKELVRSLIEYQKIAEAAKTLRELEEERLKIYSRAVPQSERNHPLDLELELNLYELMKAFREIAANFEPSAMAEIEPEEFTIEDKIESILKALSLKGQIAFADLFARDSSRLEMVVTFIALLELIKRSAIRARQDKTFGRIWLYQAAEDDENHVEVKTKDSGSD